MLNKTAIEYIGLRQKRTATIQRATFIFPSSTNRKFLGVRMQVDDLKKMFPEVSAKSLAKAFSKIGEALKGAKTDKVFTYCFYWDDDADSQFFMKIRADVETVEKLLDIYRGLDEDYNNADWLNFLNAVGVEAEIVDDADYYIYF